MDFKKYNEVTLKKLQQTELAMLKDFVTICKQNNISYFGIGGTAIGALRHKGFIPWDDDIDLAFVRDDYEKFCTIIKKDYKDKYTILRADEDKNYPLFTARMCLNGTTFREHAMKNVDCDFGIFLDLYAYDNIPNNEFLMKLQAIRIWMYSKFLILCSISKPNLLIYGFKKKVILAACKVAYTLMKLLHIKKEKLFLKGKKLCMKYNHKSTNRLAYLPEARPFASMIKRKDLYPLQTLPFEGLELSFPHNMHALLEPYYGDYMQIPPEEKRYNHCPYQLKFKEEEGLD